MNKLDVIQIKPDAGINQVFHGKLAIVDEVKSWGCIAYVETFEGKAYIRLSSGTYEVIGSLIWVPMEEGTKEG